MIPEKRLTLTEKRFEELERKYSVIQERIQAYDAVLSEFQALKAELKGNRKTIETFVSASGSVFDELRLKIDTYAAQFQILHGNGESNAKALEDHRQIFSKYVGTQNKIYNDFSEVVTKIKDQLEKAFDQKNHITNCYAESLGQIRWLQKAYEEAKVCHEKLLNDHLKFKDATEESNSSLEKQISKVTRTVAALPSLQEWANTLYSRVQQDMGYRDKQATAYVDKKIDQLASDFDANPLSAHSIRSDLFNEMQALAREGKNAQLKSNEHEEKLRLLEKKLESLNVLIKKYEIYR